jgi:putative aldouronate transport system substrate-binding protein
MGKISKRAGLAVSVLWVYTSVLVSACFFAGGESNREENVPRQASSGNEWKPSGITGSGPPASELPPEHITLYVPAGEVPKDLQQVNKAVSDYLKAKINATFEMTVIDWGSWKDKINLKIAASEKFELVWTVYWDSFSSRVQQGAYLPLNDLLDKYGQTAKNVIDPVLLEGGRFPDGYNYGLPVNKEAGSQFGVLLRKDLLDKYRLDPSKVKSLEDLEPMFEVIKRNEPNIVPFYTEQNAVSANSVTNALNYIDLAFFGALYRNSNDFKVINKFEDPLFKEGLMLQRKWYESGYINKDAAIITDFSGGIKSGKAFSFVEWLKPGKAEEESSSLKFDWVQVDLTKPFIHTTDTMGSMISISRTSSNPERAMMFLNMLYSDPYLVNLLSFGIEGKHWMKVDGKPNIIKLPDGVTAQGSGYNPGTAWMFGNQFLNYTWENENPQKWEKLKAFTEQAERSRTLGFIFDMTPVRNEIAAYNNIMDQYGPGLLSGTLDPEKYLPEFLQKIKSVGGDKIIAELQRQLDEWLANKKPL